MRFPALLSSSMVSLVVVVVTLLSQLVEVLVVMSSALCTFPRPLGGREKGDIERKWYGLLREDSVSKSRVLLCVGDVSLFTSSSATSVTSKVVRRAVDGGRAGENRGPGSMGNLVDDDDDGEGNEV